MRAAPHFSCHDILWLEMGTLAGADDECKADVGKNGIFDRCVGERGAGSLILLTAMV